MSRKPVIVGVLVALAGAGAYAAFQYFWTPKGSLTFNSGCGYESCGWRGAKTLRMGDTYPGKCPKCGKPSVFAVSQCKRCGHTQVLNEILREWQPEFKNLPEKTMCKKCGGPIFHGD